MADADAESDADADADADAESDAGRRARTAVHTALNALSAEQARAAFARCCGSTRWTDGMLARRPFSTAAALFSAADAVWAGLDRADYLQAFSHHPAIGARAGDRQTAAGSFSAQEQAQVAQAGATTLQALAALNRDYQQRFGFVFLVCATGKSADQMLALLRARIDNPPEIELRIAAGEQAKITRLRLEKLAP
jgi:2-oxo-4-hydroxy-4-carboxy-5-ureidoimidazoline decarboxylase